MCRFTLLYHKTDSPHYDLLFEEIKKDSLLTLQILPDDLEALLQGREIRTRLLPRHRKKYLDYEGMISHDRGYVQQVDSGTWRPDKKVRILEGTLLKGKMVLEQNDESCRMILQSEKF